MPCLSRLKLTGVGDQLDSLIDEASVMISQCVRRLALLCERKIARKDQHHIETALKLAQVPFLRDLTGFDFAAQPSVDPKQIRDLAPARGVSNGENGRTGSKVRYRVDGFAAKAAICSSDAGIVPRINRTLAPSVQGSMHSDFAMGVMKAHGFLRDHREHALADQPPRDRD
jgi:hypothetical protein